MMAYKFINGDGDEAIHFEHGKWDSIWGYECPHCRTYIGDPEEAMKHENELPCLTNPDKYNNVLWSSKS